MIHLPGSLLALPEAREDVPDRTMVRLYRFEREIPDSATLGKIRPMIGKCAIGIGNEHPALHEVQECTVHQTLMSNQALSCPYDRNCYYEPYGGSYYVSPVGIYVLPHLLFHLLFSLPCGSMG